MGSRPCLVLAESGSLLTPPAWPTTGQTGSCLFSGSAAADGDREGERDREKERKRGRLSGRAVKLADHTDKQANKQTEKVSCAAFPPVHPPTSLPPVADACEKERRANFGAERSWEGL